MILQATIEEENDDKEDGRRVLSRNSDQFEAVFIDSKKSLTLIIFQSLTVEFFNGHVPSCENCSVEFKKKLISPLTAYI